MLHELNADLQTAEQTLQHWTVTFPKVARQEASAKITFELAWADAIDKITSKVPEGGRAPTVAVMDAEATRLCADQLKAKRMAEAEAEIAKKLIGIAETTLTSIQSRLKLEIIEAGLS